MKLRIRAVLMPLAAALGLAAAATPAAPPDPVQECYNRCERQYNYCMLVTCSQNDCAHVCEYRYDQCTQSCYAWA